MAAVWYDVDPSEAERIAGLLQAADDPLARRWALIAGHRGINLRVFVPQETASGLWEATWVGTPGSVTRATEGELLDWLEVNLGVQS